ncbi:MAG: sodium-dependent bicarbonate transport family permease [Bdellovibrionales bacterium]|nr:sodium-dependent bicarbonate transport family permease [Bdellovibrionales bacterium]
MIQNLLDPTILCFIVGLVSGLVKSDLRLPRSSYDFVSLYLLLAIGFKGGVQLSKTNFGEFVPALFATLAVGVLIPVIAYFILRASKKVNQADAGSIAGHYGSVSAVTFATSLAFLESLDVSYEPYMMTLVVILEIPAICVGIFLAKGGLSSVGDKNKLARDILLGKSIFLLGGGLLIGYLAGPEKMAPLDPLFVDLFKGFLALFLLEMGVIASQQMGHLKKTGLFLLFFALTMPVISGVLGLCAGHLIGLSLGGKFLLAILSASASYIAAPSAMKIAVPEANPTLSLTASLAITFPFNITLGIPLFYLLARTLPA